MPSPTTITVAELARLVGLPTSPVIVGVRTGDENAADPRLITAARRHDFNAVATWAKS
jgi:hypothetical protein